LLRAALIAIVKLATLWMPPAQAQGSAAAGDGALSFDILEYVVVGNTLLSVHAIEVAVYPYLGPARSAAASEAARKALEKAYQDAGYLSATVALPPQRIDPLSGQVRLEVTEAPVERLRITGAQHFLPSLIAAQVPSVAPGSVPNFNDMQAELDAVSRQTADREITPVISAGERPGTMAVELKVQDKLPLNGSVELNSKQAQNTERGRLEAGITYDNLFQRLHSIGLFWLVSPSRMSDSNVLSLSYRLPLQGDGDTLSLLLTRSDSDTPTALGGSTITRGSTLGLRWRDELRAPLGLQHALTWQLSYRDLRDRNADVAGFATEAPPLRYPSFALSYDLARSGGAVARLSTLQASITFGLAATGRRTVNCAGTELDQFGCKRSGAAPGFQVFNLGLSHREPVLGNWSAYARLQGQFASGPLVPAEQSTLGGVDSVRGYYEGEQAGDYSLALRLELDTPPLFGNPAAVLKAQLFHDRAELGRENPLPGEIDQSRMASIGFGLRLETRFGLHARLDWARVLLGTLRNDSSGGQVPVSGKAAGRGNRVELAVRQSF
jgi:hemolysin activation/secretion protein